jgi:hypothetical protein
MIVASVYGGRKLHWGGEGSKIHVHAARADQASPAASGNARTRHSHVGNYVPDIYTWETASGIRVQEVLHAVSIGEDTWATFRDTNLFRMLRYSL